MAQHATTPANWSECRTASILFAATRSSHHWSHVDAQQVPLGLLQYMLYLRGGNFFADDAEEKKALVAVSKALRVRRDLANPTVRARSAC